MSRYSQLRLGSLRDGSFLNSSSTQWQRLAVVGALLAITLPTAVPLLRSGLPEAANKLIHLLRVVQLDVLIKDGYLLPRWGPDIGYGWGFPVFNYYAPLSYYVLELFYVLGLSLDNSLKLTLMVAAGAYAAGGYLWARTIMPAGPALVVATANLYAPARFMESYRSHSLGQILAMALLAFALWAFYGLMVSGSKRWFVAATGLLTAIILTHNITALFVAPMIVFYALMVAAGRREIVGLFRSGLAILFSGGLSAFFWTPALLERHYIQTERGVRDIFDVARNLLDLREVLSPSPVTDLALKNPDLPFSVGPALVVFALLGTTLAFWPRCTDRILRYQTIFAATAVGALIFLVTPASALIWQNLPLLSFVQFPSRLLGLATTPAALLCGVAALRCGELLRHRLTSLFIPAFLVFFLVAVESPRLYPLEPFTDSGDLHPVDILDFELQTGAIGTTSTGEFTPVWVLKWPTGPPVCGGWTNESRTPKLDSNCLPDGVQAEWVEGDSLREEYTVTVSAPTTIQYPVFYFPAWRVAIDDEAVAARPAEGTGVLTFDVPEGLHRLKVWYGRTPVEQAAEYISLMALVGFLGLLALIRNSRRRQTVAVSVTVNDDVISPPLLIAALLLVMLTLKITFFDRYTELLSYRSPVGTVRDAQYNVDVTIGGKVKLIGYDLNRRTIMPGEAINITVYWQSIERLGDDYRSVMRLLDMNTGEAIANSDNLHPGGRPIRTWWPSQYVADRHVLTLPASASPVAYQLQAGLYREIDGKYERLLRPGIDGWQADHVPLTFVVVRPTEGEEIVDRRFEQTDVVFEEELRLRGYTLERLERNELRLTLQWRADKKPTRDFSVFVHVLDRSGKVVHQIDAKPLQWTYPTIEWAAGEEVDDVYILGSEVSSSEDLSLAIGLYNAEAGMGYGGRKPNGEYVDAVRIDNLPGVQPR